jgi:predicted transcriptional regulator of viral defense system
MNDLNGRYQICGPNANYRYGWEDQVPNRIYAYNNRISGTRTVAKIQLNLIKVGDQRLGGVEKSQDTNGIEVVYSSKARALVDAVYDWSRFNTLPRAFGWILTELQKNKDLPSRLAELTVRYGNQGTARRMGMLLEKGGIQPPLLRKINRVLRPTTSLIPWVPTLPKRGQVNRRWGVIVNYDSE